MAILVAGGAETGDTAELNNISSGATFQTSVVKTGTYALRTNPTGSSVQWGEIRKRGANGRPTTVLDVATAYYSFYFRYATKPAATNDEICRILDTAAAMKMTVRITSAGKLQAYDNVPAQMGSDGATVLSADTWYLIEVQCGTGASAAWEIKINETSELSGTGAVGTTNNGSLRLGKAVNQNGNTVDFFYDDWVISDSAYVGTHLGATLIPTGDGTYTDWTGDYTALDEIPHDSDTTTVLSVNVNDAETVHLTDSGTASISGTIHCVETYAWVKRATASNGAVVVRTRSNTTDTDTGTNFTTTASYAVLGQTHIVDPATSAAWTTGGIDALQVGVVNKNGVNDSLCSALHAYVCFTLSVGGATAARNTLTLLGVG